MTAPVRIRGEVGERRKLNPESRPGAFTRPEVFINGVWRRCRRHTEGFFEMRHDETTAARVDAIVARFKAALAELQQQHRDERARDAAEIARLRAEARLLAALVHDEAKLASGQTEGCHE